MIAMGVAHVTKRERYVERLTPAAKAVAPAAKAVAATEKPAEKIDNRIVAIGFLYIFLHIVFNLWIASIAYRCNGDSMIWGAFGFVAPIFYIIVHAAHWFRCDRLVPALSGGAKRAKGFSAKRK